MGAFVVSKFITSRSSIISHAGVGGATSLWWHPVDVLAWILDIASFAVDAVLCVDLKPHPLHPVLPLHILVHPSRTIVLFWATVCRQISLHRHGIVHQRQVGWLVMVVICPCECHRGQKVKANLAIWLGVLDRFAVL